MSSIYNSSVVNPQATNSVITSAPSQWLVKRLLDAFTDAVAEQSKQADVPSFRSKSMLSYCTSPFAAICMTTATCLNRIVIFAASRRNRKLPWFSMAILRLIALYILFQGSFGLIVALKTYARSPGLKNFIPDYYKFDKDSFYELKFLGMKYSSTYYAGIFTKRIPTPIGLDDTIGSSTADPENIFKAFLIAIVGKKVSSLLLGNDSINIDYSHTVKYEEITKIFYGPTPAILKPFYLSLCMSQVLETFIAVASGYEPTVENGLTLFEYSLAFQEVQSANRPSIELIFISMIALVNKSSTHLLGLFGLLDYRLIPSTCISLFGLTLYAHILLHGRLFVIPFTVVMGYLPQLLVFAIILLCSVIFFTAAVFKGSLRDLAFIEILENLNSINISLSDDFYTALINVGEFVITTAGEYSYFKEFHSVKLPLQSYIVSQKNEKMAKMLKNEKKKLVAYANEFETHPDLLNERSKVMNTKAKSWIISKRLKNLKRILGLWTDLLVSSILRRRPGFLEDSTTGSLNPEMESLVREFQRVNDGQDQPSDRDPLFEYEDNSADYTVSESDIEQEEFDSDYVSEEEEAQEVSDSAVGAQEMVSNVSQLFTTQELASLINPTSLEDIKMSRILGSHLSNTTSGIMVTRSKFNNLYNSNKSQVLEDLLLEKRHEKGGPLGSLFNLSQQDAEGDDEDELYSGLGKCVVCHTNSRQIIVWPCRCLSICEACRVSLIVRNFSECVCCRSKVEGYSKVYIP